MIPALEVRGLAKSYVVGAANCLATAQVLRGISLTAHAGDTLGIVGSAGAGKSTLFLCLAGLLTPDAGAIRWFGDSSRDIGFQRVVYHVARTDLLRGGRAGASNIHLVDVGDATPFVELERWIAARRDAGDAVLVAARDGACVDGVVSRVMHLERGALRSMPIVGARVAEPAPT